jgi:hypothetical protein
MDSKEIIEFKCRKCGVIVAKRQGNLLFTDGQIMSLFHGGFAFPCECGETFYFDFRKAGILAEPWTAFIATAVAMIKCFGRRENMSVNEIQKKTQESRAKVSRSGRLLHVR